MCNVLNDYKLNEKLTFIEDYISASNPANGSKFDSNANMENKNLVTLESELVKDFYIQINRAMIYKEISELFGVDLAKEYIRQITDHEIYIHDETSLKPYCASISLYPFLLHGMKKLNGEGTAPKHLLSFCGGFINLVFATSSQFAGAIATVEFLMYFDYFARNEYGPEYIKNNEFVIKSYLQQVVYSINQPGAARGYQSVFWNISIYDKYYFEAMFGNFCFPDGTKPSWESLNELQKFFMKWFNEERKIAVLTYPVVTAACLIDTNTNKLKDINFQDFISTELAEGNSFFIFMNENAQALSSCCRLKNNIEDNINDFSYSLGAGGVSTGSVKVITLNINRIIQKNINLLDVVQKVHKYHVAYRKILKKYEEKNMLPVYNAGFISMEKQYSTIGINGLLEAAEFLGYDIAINNEYMNFVENILKTISDENIIAKKKYGFRFNTEFVPAENLGVKNANWDTKDGLKSNRECYNSYLYKVEDDALSILDKFKLHGRRFMKYLDGGSAYHCNLDDYPTKGTFSKLLDIAAKEGCEYFCFNIKITICNDCLNIDKRTLTKCPKCQSKNIDYGTRIIGYLKRISSFSDARQREHGLRFYANC